MTQRNRMIAYLISLCVLASISQASVLSDLAKNLMPKTWVAIPSASSIALGRSWIYYSDSGCWDPIREQVRWVGAPVGHSIYKMITYDVKTDKWKISDCPFSASGHAYDGNTTDPATGNHYFALYASKNIKKYNGSSWSELLPVPMSVSVANAAAWFPELNGGKGGLVFVTGSGKSAWYNGSAWSEISNGQTATWGSYHVIAEYNPVYKTVLLGGGNNNTHAIARLNSDLSIHQLQDAPINIRITNSLTSVDPVTGKYIVLNCDGSNFWEYDIEKDTWAQITGMKNVPELRCSAFHAPIPEYGVIFYFSLTGPNGNDKGYAYLYKHEVSNISINTKPAIRHDNHYTLKVEPNPFHTLAKIRLFTGLTENMAVKLLVYDLYGKLLRQQAVNLLELKSGINWNASGIPCGIYLLKADMGIKQCSKRVLVIK